MREIKFRAWHKAEKKMCEVTLLRPNEGAFLVGVAPEENQVVELLGKAAVIYASENGRYCNWDEFELLQYTGEKDKNGTEIYEGNYINVYFKDGRLYGHGYLTFKHGSFFIYDMVASDLYAENLDCEVIGNIYENPELLK